MKIGDYFFCVLTQEKIREGERESFRYPIHCMW